MKIEPDIQLPDGTCIDVKTVKGSPPRVFLSDVKHYMPRIEILPSRFTHPRMMVPGPMRPLALEEWRIQLAQWKRERQAARQKKGMAHTRKLTQAT